MELEACQAEARRLQVRLEAGAAEQARQAHEAARGGSDDDVAGLKAKHAKLLVAAEKCAEKAEKVEELLLKASVNSGNLESTLEGARSRVDSLGEQLCKAEAASASARLTLQKLQEELASVSSELSALMGQKQQGPNEDEEVVCDKDVADVEVTGSAAGPSLKVTRQRTRGGAVRGKPAPRSSYRRTAKDQAQKLRRRGSEEGGSESEGSQSEVFEERLSKKELAAEEERLAKEGASVAEMRTDLEGMRSMINTLVLQEDIDAMRGLDRVRMSIHEQEGIVASVTSGENLSRGPNCQPVSTSLYFQESRNVSI